MLFCDVFRKTVKPLSGSGRLISGEYDNSTKAHAMQAISEYLIWLHSMGQTSDGQTGNHSGSLSNFRRRTSVADYQMVQTSDRKPSRLPFRLKEFRTSARFPISQHSGILLSTICYADGFETRFCLKCLQITGVSYMAGGRNNKGLLLRDTSHLFLKFIEFPYNWYPGPY